VSVCLVSGSAVINWDGRTNLSCPLCTVYLSTSLFDSTRVLARCAVGLPGASGPVGGFVWV
jgi:hypothetical protein